MKSLELVALVVKTVNIADTIVIVILEFLQTHIGYVVAFHVGILLSSVPTSCNHTETTIDM